ncbi:MAG: acetyl-CoA carboxylase biotin carboxylase subunit [Saprospiraceae bacterium]|nr:acetyl-CoA carboxylase biotin carboxylase subunit [Saprospiraceae bacterium]
MKILIANRGEISCRVIKTAQKMGIRTVAIYSDIDAGALHTKMADEAYHIGGNPSTESYLRGDKIIDLALKCGAEAIHPGYGFLSENAAFADAVNRSGLIFIGPSSDAIKTMGSKLAAKEAVKQFDIPLVPGTDEPITDIDEAKKIAEEIGFPILIKASAGGGGKGMRIVDRREDFDEKLKMAISEATSSFGDGSVFIEKFVTNPRHIEFQILADNHGNIVHLFERECSVQRRHQKVVEEAPSAVLTKELRKKMGEAAVNVARSCNYSGAGTVEFLIDDQLNFYFLEMNTRLQVEHPVTEWITGIDLVEQQIKIARNEILELKQEDLTIKGHSIELRVYAEDPHNNFLPSIDKLKTYILPEGKNIRVDNGYEEGMEIPIYYDPMISKLITYGPTRNAAIQEMINAIQEYEIEGIATTLPFGSFVMHHDAFVTGNFDTNFVKKYYSIEAENAQQKLAAKIAAHVSLHLENKLTHQLH